MINDLTRILDNVLILLDIFKGKEANKSVTEKRWSSHHRFAVPKSDVKVKAQALSTAILTSVRITITLRLATKASLI